MTDEIRIYHVDDPNDAPDRRLGAFPTINPFALPQSLPQYVIEPVANSLYTAMQYYWYYQGIAAQRQHQHQQQHDTQHQHLHQQQHEHQLQLQLHQHQYQHNLQQQQQQQQRQQPPEPQSTQHQLHELSSRASDDVTTTTSVSVTRHESQQSASPAASTAQMASSSSASSSSGSSRASVTSSSSPRNHHHHHSHSHNHHHDHNHNHLQTSSEPNHYHRSQSVSSVEQEQARKQEHIKKPLNPFMIFMQKQRPEIVRQGIIKESAAINQLLGQQWRKLTREEQEPYYKLAEQEKILHAQKYPGWSARDNYANQKKRKKLKLKSISLNGLDQSDKKCRARFGLQNMASWCKPCKRKKKCIYSMPKSSNRLQQDRPPHQNHTATHPWHGYDRLLQLDCRVPSQI